MGKATGRRMVILEILNLSYQLEKSNWEEQIGRWIPESGERSLDWS